MVSILGFCTLRETSHHAQMNGIFERASRTIKTALLARNESWLDTLPIIIMGIFSATNSFNTHPPFTGTGRHIIIPQMLVDNTKDNIYNQKFAKEIKRDLHSLHPTDNYYSSVNKSRQYVPGKLMTFKNMWLRVDRVYKQFEASYISLFQALRRTYEYFKN